MTTEFKKWIELVGMQQGVSNLGSTLVLGEDAAAVFFKAFFAEVDRRRASLKRHCTFTDGRYCSGCWDDSLSSLMIEFGLGNPRGMNPPTT